MSVNIVWGRQGYISIQSLVGYRRDICGFITVLMPRWVFFSTVLLAWSGEIIHLLVRSSASTALHWLDLTFTDFIAGN